VAKSNVMLSNNCNSSQKISQPASILGPANRKALRCFRSWTEEE